MEGFWREVAIFSNSLESWAIAIAAANIAYFTIMILRRVLVKRLATNNLPTDYDELVLALLRATKTLTVFFFAVLIGNGFLEVPLFKGSYRDFFVAVLIAVQVGIWGEVFVSHFITRSSSKDPTRATTMVAFGFVARIVLWVLLLLLILENLGINVTALLTGLGVGGVAVALAVQNILGDLFASMSIVLDKPFVIGDVIQVGSDVGIVEKVGLKTTRVKSLSGEQLIYSNSELLKQQIRNYKRMNERRVAFTLQVTYDTPEAKLALIPNILKGIIEGTERTRFDRCHFLKFNTSSLDYEIVYYVLNPDYNLFCDIQQKINLAILNSFRAENIEFAFPTSTVHISGAAK